MISTLDAHRMDSGQGAGSAARRLLVIGDSAHPRVLDQFASRHPDWCVVRADTLLAGIAEACRERVDAVVTAVPPSEFDLSRGLIGLREAAGSSPRVLLSCRPESEPAARQSLGHGANDYLVAPIEIGELESAIGVAPPVEISATSAATSSEELAAIVDALSTIDARPADLLKKLADAIRAAVGARGVTLSISGAGAGSGEPVTQPVIAFPIEFDAAAPSQTSAQESAGAPGRLIVGEKTQGPYLPADVERLMQYARLAGRVLLAAQSQRKWRELAMIDPGSGLPNRRYMLDQLPAILERAAREQFAVTVLLFDVDDFKSFNDRHGHDAGDEILRVVGQLFRRTCREQDIVTRYGGDEFAVVFWDPAGPREPGSRHPQQALSVVDRFTKALRDQRFPRLGPEGGHVTISGGLATFPWDATTVESLISRADEALLAAKRAGKNRVVAVTG